MLILNCTRPATTSRGVRIMGYDALDCAAFADIAGLRIWAGDDLTVVADPIIGKCTSAAKNGWETAMTLYSAPQTKPFSGETVRPSNL